MADVQLAFYWQRLRLKRAVPAHLILADLDDVSWVGSWWSQVLQSLQQLRDLADDALHGHIVRGNVYDARVHPPCGKWAAGIYKKQVILACSPLSQDRTGGGGGGGGWLL